MKRLPSVRSWLRRNKFYDTLFALYDFSRKAARRALTLGGGPARRLTRRSWQPALEGLEVRQMPSTLQFAQATYTVNESASLATIPVERTGSTASCALVAYTTADATALNGRDYTTSSGSLYFPPGVATASFTVPILDRGLTSGQESLHLSLSCPSAGDTLDPSLSSASLVILDNDTSSNVIAFTTATYTVDENASLVTITVERSGSTASSASADYTTEDGSAVAGRDYTTASGTLFFAMGDASARFTVSLLDRGLSSGQESLGLSLSAPSPGATLDPSLGTATLLILDNDPPPGVIAFTTATYTVNESTSLATITVTRSGSTADWASADYTTMDGSAVAGLDYTTADGAITFGPGDATTSFTVPILDRGLTTGQESLRLSLSSPSTGETISSTLGTASLIILDNDPDPVATGTAFNATEQAPFSGVAVATFTDADPNLRPWDFGALIDWGDGSGTSAGTVQAVSCASYDVVGDHTYTEEGTYTVTVEILDPAGTSTAWASGSATVADPAVTPSGGFAVTATEGADSGLQTVATFTDPGGTEDVSDYSASIAWGDGTAASAGVLTAGPGGVFTVQGNHTYAEESAAEHANSQPYLVTVTLAHDQAPAATAYSSASVAEAAVVASGGFTVQAVEGQDSGLQTVATFIDPGGSENVADYSALIAWGDGSAPSVGVVSVSGRDFRVQGDHAYAEESAADHPGSQPYALTVTLAHENAPTASAFSSATVAETAVQASGGFTVQAVEGQDSGLQTVATFTDPGGAEALADYGASIDWGDQTSATPGTLSVSGGGFTVQGNHPYAEEGTFPVTVTLTHEQAPNATARSSAVVADAPLSGLPWPEVSHPAAPFGIVPTAGGPLTAWQNVALTGALLATFTAVDPHATAADFQANLAWGDGTFGSASVVANGGQAFSVFGDHTFVLAGPFTARINLTEDGLPALTDAQGHPLTPFAVPIDVSANPVPPSPPSPLHLTAQRVSGTEDAPLSAVTVATFVDDNLAHLRQAHTFTIYWGDGAQSAGSWQVRDDLDAIAGSHTYARAGAYLLTITLADETGHAVTAYATAFIDAVAPVASLHGINASAGQPFRNALLGTVRNPNGSEDVHALGVTLNWGDGSASGLTLAGTAPAYWLVGGHTYAASGPYILTLTVVDSDGGYSRLQGGVQVGDAVAGQDTTLPLGTFRDADPAGTATDYTARVDWGDGTDSAGSVAASGTSPPAFAVTGDHTWGQAGPVTVTSTVRDVGGASTTLTRPVSVMLPPLLQVFPPPPPPPPPPLPPPLVEGVAFDPRVLADFTDGGFPGSYAVTIDWGDGSRSAGTVGDDAVNHCATVLGGHTYALNGTFPVTILLEDTRSARTLVLTSALTITPATGPLTPQAQDIAGVAGVDTGPVRVATVAAPFALDQDPLSSASIAWGDGTSSAGTLVADPVTPGLYDISGDHVYAAEGRYTFTVSLSEGPNSLVTPPLPTAVAHIVAASFGAQERDGSDPQRLLLTPLAEAQADLNTGGLRLTQPLDFDLSPGTSAGGDPALAYNSATVNPQAYVQVTVSTAADQPLPDTISLQLTWDGVVTGGASFGTAGYTPGQALLLAVAVPDGTGTHAWSVSAQLSYAHDPTPAPGQPDVPLTTPLVPVGSGTAVLLSQQASLVGPGWGIAGVDHLAFLDDGVLWVTGTGDSRFFADNAANTDWGDGPYFAPAEGPGLLVQHDDFSFTYTTPDQTVWQFDKRGLLLSVTDRDGVGRGYTYDLTGRLTAVTATDRSTTTLAYDGSTGLLDSITEPGPGRVVTLGHAGDGTLTSVTDVDGSTRTFTYGGGLLTRDQWAPYDTSFRYGSGGMVSGASWGAAGSMTVVAAAGQGLSGAVPARLLNAATVTDGLGQTSTYGIDLRGRELSLTDATGATQIWVRNAAGDATSYVDGLHRTTTYTYDSADGLTAQSNPDGGWTTYQYDPTYHQLVRQETAVAAGTSDVTTYTLNGSGDAMVQTEAAGTPLAATTTYVWSGGLLVSTTDPDGNETTTAYDGWRRPTTTDTYDAQGDLQGYSESTYDSYGEVYDTLDHAGNYTLTLRDPRGQVQTEETFDANGTLVSRTTTAYLPSGLVSSTTDGDNNVTDDTYDARGQLLSEKLYAADGTEVEETDHTYDAAGNETETLAGDGSYTLRSYDGAGRVLSEIVYDANSTEVGATATAYDAAGEATQTSDGAGDTTTTSYDGLGRVLSEAVRSAGGALARSTSQQYDLTGEDTASVDGDGNTTAYTYDVRGDVLSTQLSGPGQGLLRQTTDRYDRDGQVTEAVDGAGNTTDYSYDALGDVLSTTVYSPSHVLLRQSTSRYDDDGNPTQAVDGAGNTTTYAYDGAGEVTSTTLYNALGQFLRSTSDQYDGAGNVTQALDGAGNKTVTAYDAAGAVTATTLSNAVGQYLRGTSATYDGDGRETQAIDGAGNTTTYAYDGAGAVTGTALYNSTGAFVRGTSDQYDGAGQVTQAIDGAGNTTTYAYDAAGDVTSTTLFNAAGFLRQTLAKYDGDGNVTQTVDGAGTTTVSTYDAAGEVTGTSLFNSLDQFLRGTSDKYDGDGNVTQTIDGDGNTTTYAYDAAGEVTGTTLYNSLDQFLRGTSDKYDGDGQVTQEVDGAGNTTTYAYDAAGDVTSTTLFNAAGFLRQTLAKYDGDGNVTQEVDGAGTTTVSTYDAAGDVTGTTLYNALGQFLRSTSEQYDGDGNVTQTVDGAGNKTISAYDAAGDVTGTTLFNALGQFLRGTSDKYDGAGNVTQAIDGAGNTTVSAYDDAGEVTGTTLYNAVGQFLRSTSDKYDGDGNVTQAIDGDGNTTTYAYDAAGDVTGTTLFNSLGQFLRGTSDKYDGDGQVTQEVDGAGNTTTYAYDAAGEVTGTTLYSSLGQFLRSTSDQYDGDGNVTQAIDGAGNTTTYAYDAAGEVTDTTLYSSTDALLRSTSEQYDGDGNVTQTVDGAGNTTVSAYDAAGDVTNTTLYNALGQFLRSTSDQYDGDGNVTQAVDGAGNKTVSAYDAAGDVMSTALYNSVGAFVRSTSDQYDGDGNVTQAIDGAGNKTVTTYDAAGEVTGTTLYNSVGAFVRGTSDQYDGDGNVTQAIDGAGNTTVSAYDAAGDVTGTTLYNALGQSLRTTSDKYDGDGNVTQAIDGDGNTTVSAYDAAGDVTGTALYSATGALLRSTSEKYDGDGNVTQAIDGDGNTTVSSYDAAGDVTGTTLYNSVGALVRSMSDRYDGGGNVTQAIDGAGNTTVSAYDAAGEVTGTTLYNALGQFLRSTSDKYDGDGNVTQALDGVGNTTTYAYDAAGDVTGTTLYSSTGVFLRSTLDKYDGDGNVTQAIDGDGNTTVSSYDAAGDVTGTTLYSATGALLRSTSEKYDGDGKVTQALDGAGNTTVSAYDAAGDVTSTTLYGSTGALLRSTSEKYDGDGNVTQAIDGDGNTTVSAYDAAGNVTGTTLYSALGQLVRSTSEKYDGDGNVTQALDANGHTSTYAYDAAGDPTAVTDADGFTTLRRYDGDGNVTQTVDADGRTSTYAYDAAGDQTAVTDPDGHTRTDGYDAVGNLTQAVDAAGHTTTYAYDAAGDQTAVTNAAGFTTFSRYDGDGNVTQTVDANSHTTTYAYDAAGQRTAVTDPAGQQTVSRYDGAGNLTQVVDANHNTTTFAYDAAGNRTQTIDPLGHTSTAAYDADGNLTLTTDALGRQDRYAYDAAGRLLSETLRNADGTVSDTRTFTYDADGHTLTAASNAGAYVFAYDSDGLLTQVQEPFGVTLTFAYDADGNRTRVTDSFGGVTTSTYDPAGLLTQREMTGPNEAPLRIDLAYDAAGQLATETRYADLAGTTPVGTTTYRYDAAGQTTDVLQQDGSGVTLTEFTTTYDAAGQVTSDATDGVATTYTYDNAGQVTGVGGGGTYSYDPTGNRTTTGYQTGPDNQLLSDGTWDYSYDAAGNETGKTNIATGEVWTYGYDNRNDLVSAVEKASNGALEAQVTDTYDVYGNRLSEDAWTAALGDVLTKFAYDGWNPAMATPVGNENFNVILDMDGSGSLTTEYLRGDVVDQVFGRIGADSSQPLWYQSDRQGSVRGLTDGTGAVQDAVQYDAFGNVVSETNPAMRGRYGWQGREDSRILGLQEHHERWYDPATGRWMSQDPLGFAAGDSNLYRYVHNHPTNGSDPSGLSEPVWQNESGKDVLYYRPGGFNSRELVYVGVLDESRKYVVREGMSVKWREAEAACGGSWGRMPTWDNWFATNYAEAKVTPYNKRLIDARYAAAARESQNRSLNAPPRLMTTAVAKSNPINQPTTPPQRAGNAQQHSALGPSQPTGLPETAQSPPAPAPVEYVKVANGKLGGVEYDYLPTTKTVLAEVQRTDHSADGNYVYRYEKVPRFSALPAWLEKTLSVVGNGTQFVVGVFLIETGVGAPAGAYLIFRSSEATLSEFTGKEKLSTQLGRALFGEGGAKGVNTVLFIVDFGVGFKAAKGAGTSSSAGVPAGTQGQSLTFYRGTTRGSALEIVESQALDVARIRQNQLLAGHPESLQGVFITSQEATAQYFADLAALGPVRRGLGPAVIRIEVPASDFAALARRFNIPVEQAMPRPPVSGMTETLLPFGSVAEFEAFARFFLH